MKMRKQTIVIFGSGAIGRGFLPWKLDLSRYDLVFVDENPEIVNRLKSNHGYLAFKATEGRLEENFVAASEAYEPQDIDLGSYGDLAMVFVAVGVSNVQKLRGPLASVDAPIVLCENDPDTVETLKRDLNRENIYFAIPDVITSCTASKANLDRDPLAIHTESGTLYVDDRAQRVDGDIIFLDSRELLEKHWLAKLFLHNTPHCIAAYLGALEGCDYLHEVMTIPALRKVVRGAMDETLAALKHRNPGEQGFLDSYAEKELARFADEKLFDPISRVAREPYRKLAPHGRLVGAAELCLSAGVGFENISIGIVCAALYACRQNSTENPRGNLRFSPLPLPTAEEVTAVFREVRLHESEAYARIAHRLDIVLSEKLPNMFKPV
jgi:mannitol-1-phosphate/altronate dehydrogenase